MAKARSLPVSSGTEATAIGHYAATYMGAQNVEALIKGQTAQGSTSGQEKSNWNPAVPVILTL